LRTLATLSVTQSLLIRKVKLAQDLHLLSGKKERKSTILSGCPCLDAFGLSQKAMDNKCQKSALQEDRFIRAFDRFLINFERNC
jgi:hypothetical protein